MVLIEVMPALPGEPGEHAADVGRGDVGDTAGLQPPGDIGEELVGLIHVLDDVQRRHDVEAL